MPPPINYGNPIPPPINYGNPMNQYPPSNQYPSYPPPTNYGSTNQYPQYPSNSYPSYPQGSNYTGGSNLRQTFDQWDLNRNGHIDENELAQALRQMGEISDPETVRAMIKAYDVDGSGTIDFYEFSDLYNYIQNLKSSFSSTSGDISRGIGFGEAKNILTSMSGTSLIAAPVLLYSFWKVYERSGKGKVSYKDFILMAFALKTIMKNYNKQSNSHQRW